MAEPPSIEPEAGTDGVNYAFDQLRPQVRVRIAGIDVLLIGMRQRTVAAIKFGAQLADDTLMP
jgi:hypothetical protein